MKYEIKGSRGNYSVFYGRGYPWSAPLKYACFTLRGAHRVIRRHKRQMLRGEIHAPGPDGRDYEIVYTEETPSKRDVDVRIAQLERELGIGQ